MPHLSRVVYYALTRSEDMGDRATDVLNNLNMLEAEFQTLNAGATRADQAGLAAVITGTMHSSTLQWLEAQVGKAATGLQQLRALSKRYAAVQKTGLKNTHR